MKILFIGDGSDVGATLQHALQKNGYKISNTTHPNEARKMFFRIAPAMILLDISLPETAEHGFALCQELRSFGYAGGIMFLSAHDNVADRVRGLESGGDDFLTKPFELTELLARLRAVLRRSSEFKKDVLKFSGLKLDFRNQTVHFNDKAIELTNREYEMLTCMALSPSRIFSPQYLFNKLWIEETTPTVVKVYVHRLRQKISSAVIRTTARGYQFGLN